MSEVTIIDTNEQAVDEFNSTTGRLPPEKPNWEEVTKETFDELKSICDPNNILRLKTWIMKPKSVTVWINWDSMKPNENWMEHWFQCIGNYGAEGTKYLVVEDKKDKIVIPTENPYLTLEDFPPVPQEILDRIKAYEEAQKAKEVEGAENTTETVLEDK